MGQRHSKPIREAAAGAWLPGLSDLVFTAGLSLAILAGFALGFALR